MNVSAKWLCSFGIVILIVNVSAAIVPITDESQTQTVSGLATMSSALPSCPLSVTGKLLYTQTDKKGNKLEIWCNRQYQMKITRADGSSYWVGKCPFPWGHNSWVKWVNVSITLNPDGTGTITSHEILGTYWKSVGPVGDPPITGTEGPVGTGEDRLWIYDQKSNKIVKQKTKHTGKWEKRGDEWVWTVTSQKSDGDPVGPENPPKTPDALCCIEDPPIDVLERSISYVPEYDLITPVPVTTFVNGEARTSTYKLPHLADTFEIREIVAIENSRFRFDIEMMGEDERLITYSLVDSPHGMTIDPLTGIIAWTPDHDQIGEHEVAVSMEYYGLSPITERFILKVLTNGGDPPIYKNIMAFPTPERYLGSDLNNDGDTSDTILRYQNLKTGQVVNTGLIVSGAHHAIDIYKNIIAFVGTGSRIYYYNIKTGVVGETGAIGTFPSTYKNIIVFVSEGTVHYFDLNTQKLVDTNITGSRPTVYDNLIVFHAFSPELTIWVYDLHTGTAADTGITGRDPVLYETVIAFETLESSVGEDLNGDSDLNDWVVRYYDLKDQSLTNTGAVGRYPAIHGNRIVFTTPEKAVNLDLNGDGKVLGSVIRYYNLKTGRVVNTRKLGTEPDIYDDTITYYLWERWKDQDFNCDGDMIDPIVNTCQISVEKMATAGPEALLLLALLMIGSITAYFRREK